MPPVLPIEPDNSIGNTDDQTEDQAARYIEELNENIADELPDNPVLPRQDGPKNEILPRQDAGYPPAPSENGIQWRRAGKTGWARWRMTYYRKPDNTKAQKREYINYVSDKALGKIYRIAGGKNG